MSSTPPVAARPMEPGFDTLEEAAEWYAVLRSGAVSDDEHRGWQAWLAASAAHRAAWQRVEAISHGMSIPNAQPHAADAALQAARYLRKRRQTIKAALLLTVAGLGGWSVSHTAAWQSVQAGLGADYRTGVGQMREIVLTDGSQIWLNTATALDRRYDAAQRLLVLRQGEILIETHPDDRAQARPFLVDSAQGRMRALGTRFNVRQFDGRTELDVYEGQVEVTPAVGADRRIVAAGQRVTFTRTQVDGLAPSHAAQAMWHKGILLADDMPLGDVVAELARYRRGYLACDPAVAALRVVGGFPLADTDRALAMLQATLPVDVHPRMSWWVTVRPRQ